MDLKVKALVTAMQEISLGADANYVEKDLEEALNSCEVKVWREDTNIPLPTYGKDGDACCDVYAKSIEYDEVKDRYIVHTGLHFALPNNYEMEIRPRSSNTKTEFYIPNTPGTLDSGYRGELMILFKNRTDINLFNAINKTISSLEILENEKFVDAPKQELKYVCEKFPYKEGDRIAQILVRKREVIKWKEVAMLEDLGSSERGEGGFGSTGK